MSAARTQLRAYFADQAATGNAGEAAGEGARGRARWVSTQAFGETVNPVLTRAGLGARMEPQLAPLAAILDLNTDLLLNTLEGLDDDDARIRLPGGGNSLAFLAAHLTDSRHFLADRIGRPLTNPVAPYLADARTIEDISAWPSLDALRDAWGAVSAHVQSALEGLNAGDLAHANAVRFPLADGTQLGMLTFLVQHDSYHVGQMAFLRRQLGKSAMTYRRGAGAAR